ncbi:GNAT family N-acetyltransferase [Arthrobacter castelli]|uniref:GNAT family N-acetyltransferase n=1 Tax=Arthrobacter castelli TaxID=271431 RepID=UPI000413A5F2|nr:GNAT family N-acetyltransferase [Arthrobacter castelli]
MIIENYSSTQRAEVLDLSIRTWRPVFAALRPAVPAFVYEAFYPQGWEQRQRRDLADRLDGEPENVHVALEDRTVVGWICIRLHPEDQMGEIHVLAVDPAHQRQGAGTMLMNHAFEQVSAAGMTMMMVETGADPGHLASRASYEAAGFERWPVARYFKNLNADD